MLLGLKVVAAADPPSLGSHLDSHGSSFWSKSTLLTEKTKDKNLDSLYPHEQGATAWNKDGEVVKCCSRVSAVTRVRGSSEGTPGRTTGTDEGMDRRRPPRQAKAPGRAAGQARRGRACVTVRYNTVLVRFNAPNNPD